MFDLFRHSKFAEPLETYRESLPPSSSSRRSSLGENQKGLQKKTSFVLGDEEHHVLNMEPTKVLPVQEVLDVDSSKANHHPKNTLDLPQEQV